MLEQSMIHIFGLDLNIYAVGIFTMFALFLYALYRAHMHQQLNWTDMITRDGTKVSLTKVLQLVGGVTGTFIVVKLTLQNALNFDIFGTYLAYVASIDGFSKFIMAKYGVARSDDSATPMPSTPAVSTPAAPVAPPPAPPAAPDPVVTTVTVTTAGSDEPHITQDPTSGAARPKDPDA